VTITFTFEPNAAHPASSELREFFESRPWYEVGDGRAAYDDEDSGVAFRVVWAGRDEGVESVEVEMEAPRPSFFGFELTGELEALAAEFELREGSSPEPTPFEAEGFLEAWRRSNRAAAERGELPEHSAPAARLRDAWRWNRARREYQTVLGEAIFVPALKFLGGGGTIHRACAWPETIPVALPEAADLVLLSGLQHEGLTSGDSELRVADAERVSRLVTAETDSDRLERRDDPTDHLLVGWSRPPSEVLERLGELGDPAADREFVPLGSDEIVDEELRQQTQ